MSMTERTPRWLALLLAWILIPSAVALAQGTPDDGIVQVQSTPSGVEWTPVVPTAGIALSVALPSGLVEQRSVKPGETLRFDAVDADGQPREDGAYTWEVVLTPVVDKGIQDQMRQAREQGDEKRLIELMKAAGLWGRSFRQSGSFSRTNGTFLLPQESLEGSGDTDDGSASRGAGDGLRDVVHADDVIVTGSECIGFDCLTDGTENFGFDTLKLKENNLRLFIDDTSSTAGFPANDWRLVFNDSSSGGGNYFALEDSTGSKAPLKVEAGARSSAIYTSSTGRVGFGTSTPVLDLHMVRGDTPSMRLDQDSSSGWTPQIWDVAGNESNFFIRDVTGGSKLPFRIQPGVPTNTLTMKNNGYVGIGTWSPEAKVEISTTGENAELRVARTDGATASFQSTSDGAIIGTNSYHPLAFVSNDILRATLDANGRLNVLGEIQLHNALVDTDGHYAPGKFLMSTGGGVEWATLVFPAEPDWTVAGSTMHSAVSGNVGIGTDAPAAALHLQRSDGTAEMLVEETGASAQRELLELRNNGDTGLRLTNSSGGFWVLYNGSDGFILNNSASLTSPALLVDGAGDMTLKGVLTQGSSRAIKENFEPLAGKEVLARLAGIPILRWNYSADPNAIPHAGPMAEDFYSAFGLGGDDRHLAPSDASGIALAAVQELDRQLEEKNARIADLEARICRLEALIEAQTAEK